MWKSIIVWNSCGCSHSCARCAAEPKGGSTAKSSRVDSPKTYSFQRGDKNNIVSERRVKVLNKEKSNKNKLDLDSRVSRNRKRREKKFRTRMRMLEIALKIIDIISNFF